MEAKEDVFAVLLDQASVVKSVLRNDFEKKLHILEEEEFKLHVTSADVASFDSLIAKIELVEVVLDVPIILKNSYKTGMSEIFNLSAFKAKDMIILFGRIKNHEDKGLYDELICVQNEQINEMRQLHKDRAQKIVNITDTADIEDYTKLNNQLVNTQRELVKKNQELKVALSEIRKLRQILPICANCKKIRDKGGKWTEVDVYFRNTRNQDFSHGLCEDCMRKLYPDEFDKIKK